MPFIKKEKSQVKHMIARCPYCDGYEISVDTGPAKPEFVSDYHRRDPRCEHLVFASVCRQVEVVGRGASRTDSDRSAHWYFDPANGLRRLPPGDPPDRLLAYLNDWVCDLLPPGSRPRGIEHAIVGGTDLAGGQEGVQEPGGAWVYDNLDGFAVFAPDPDTLAAAVGELAGVDPFEDANTESAPS